MTDLRYDVDAAAGPGAASRLISAGPSPRETCYVCNKFVKASEDLSIIGLQGPLLFTLRFAHFSCTPSTIINTDSDIISHQVNFCTYVYYETATGVFPAIAWAPPKYEEVILTSDGYKLMDKVPLSLKNRGLAIVDFSRNLENLHGWEVFLKDAGMILAYNGHIVTKLPLPEDKWLEEAALKGQVVLLASYSFCHKNSIDLQYNLALHIEENKPLGGVTHYFDPKGSNLTSFVDKVTFLLSGKTPELVLEINDTSPFLTQFKKQSNKLEALAESIDLSSLTKNSAPAHTRIQLVKTRSSLRFMLESRLILEVAISRIPPEWLQALSKHVVIFLTSNMISTDLTSKANAGELFGGIATLLFLPDKAKQTSSRFLQRFPKLFN